MTTILELGYWQFMFWWTVLLAGTGFVWVLFADERRKLWYDDRVKWLLWHWFTGGPLEPERLYPRTEPLDIYLTRRTITGLARTSCVAGFVACVYLADFPTDTTPLEVAGWAYGGSLALAGIVYIIAWVACRAALSIWWAHPLHDAIHDWCGWDEDMKPRHYLDFDRVHELGLALTVQCAPNVDMEDTNTTKIVEATKKKLGKDVRFVADWIGQASELRFEPESYIPDEVPFFNPDKPDEITNARRLIETAAPSKILLGLAKDEVPFWLDLDTESPHFLISAGTGGGKSETLKAFAAQALRHGDLVFILDPRRNSHIWARDLPGVHIEVDAAAIHTGLTKLAAEVDRRTAECDLLRVGDPIPNFQRVVVIVEELGTLHDEVGAWWKNQGKKGEPDGMRALRKILSMGRFLKVHIVAGAQRFDALKTGGGAARENYSWRGLAEHTHQTIEMLAKGLPVEPKTDEDKRGRMQIVHGSDVTEIRRVWMSPGDDDRPLVAWLRQGLPDGGTGRNRPPVKPPVGVPPVLDVSVTKRSAEQGEPVASVLTDPDSVLVRTTSGPSYVTLREASQDHGAGVVPMNQGALERASTRPGFPAPAEKGAVFKYSEAALVKWYWEDRPRAPRNRKHYLPLVYFICDGGVEALRWGVVIKVGKSTNLKSRLRTFQAHPDEVVRTIRCESKQEMDELEERLHNRYEAEGLRVFGDREKFRVEGSLAEFLGVVRDEVPV